MAFFLRLDGRLYRPRHKGVATISADDKVCPDRLFASVGSQTQANHSFIRPEQRRHSCL